MNIKHPRHVRIICFNDLFQREKGKSLKIDDIDSGQVEIKVYLSFVLLVQCDLIYEHDTLIKPNGN